MLKPFVIATALLLIAITAAMVWFAVLAPQRRAARIAEHTAAARAGVESINAHLESLQPPGEDAGDLLVSAQRRYREISMAHSVATDEMADDVVGDMRLGPFQRPGLPSVLELERLVDTSGLLDDLRRAGAAPRLVNRLDPSRPVDEQLVDRRFGFVRSLAKFEVARMRIAAEHANADRLVDAFDNAMLLSRVSTESGFIIDAMMGSATTIVALMELRWSLHEGNVPAAALEPLQRVIETRAPRLTLAQLLEGERLYAVAYAHQASADHLDPEKRRAREAADVEAEPFIQMARSALRTSHAYDRLLPPGFVIADAVRGVPESPDDDPESAYWAVRSAARTWAEITMLRDGARLMLALERFRIARGQYPESLGELAGEFMAAVPADALSGAPFAYRRLAEPDEHGRHYLLYSLGFNQRDDNGVESATGKRDEGDIPLNTPRRPRK